MAKTLKQQKAEKLASAAGLAPTVSENSGLSIIVSGSLGPYKAGDTLTRKGDIILYYRLGLDEGADAQTTLTDEQIWAGVKAVNVEGLEPEDIDVARIQYLEGLQSTSSKPLSDEQHKELLNTDQMAALAEAMGGMVDAQFEGLVETALEGKKAWDGVPVVLEGHLLRLYGADTLAKLPIVGTKKWDRTNRKGESTNNVPAGYNGPTDYFKVELKGEMQYLRWLDLWVKSMPHVAQLVTRLQTIKAILDGTNVSLIPPQWADYCPPKAGGVNKPVLEGFRDDISAEITRSVNRIGLALSFWQAKNAIDTHLSATVGYYLVDGTPEATAKRTKPIQMTFAAEMAGKVQMVPALKPISLSAFIRMGKKAEECAKGKGTLSELMDLAKAKRKPLTPAAGSASPVIEAKVDNIDTYMKVLAATFDYIDNHQNSIKAALADRNRAGELA